ncbi:MAG TPA: hypothetical protein VKB02_18475 [Pyrinomonadaceae bacterium]|nr:hypothetical protein [Pyrinomonadaceae bacterium]
MTASAIALTAIVCLLTMYSSRGETGVFLTTSSPSGTYRVTLSGGQHRPRVPLIDHVVFIGVSKFGKTVFQNKELYSGDWLDASFDDWYPQHQWVSDQSLVFYKDQFRQDLPNDTITLKNESQKRIAFLKIRSVDLLLIFEFEPHASTSLQVSRSRTDSTWVSVTGEFEGGQQIPTSTMSFDAPKNSGPLSLHILVSESGTTISRN